MFCSRCGKTLMPEDAQCPHCGTPVGESRFEGTPYTSAQAHILPDMPADEAVAAYTRTTYTSMTEDEQQQGSADSRTSYRPVYDGASAPEEVREDIRAAIKPEEKAPAAPEIDYENLSQGAIDTLNAVDEELTMDSVDTSDLSARKIESTGRAGISEGVEDYIHKLETAQSRKAARRRRAYDDREGDYVTPQEGEVYDDTQEVDPSIDTRQSEVFEDIDEDEFDEIRYGRTIGVKEILKVALAMVVLAALIVGGVMWFRHVRGVQSATRIPGVTQSLYDDGLRMIKSHTENTYINELVNVYRNDGLLALTQRVGQDSKALDALMPEEASENDALFVSTLQAIQEDIGNAIVMDASDVGQTSDTGAEDSKVRWATVNTAIAQLESATSAQELTAILNGERVIVAASPTPSPTPEAIVYASLQKGDKNDDVLKMQNRLYELGFLLDDRDGAFGKNTQTAVKAFQQAAGLEVTGIANNETLTLLYSDNAPSTEYAQATATPAITPTPEPEAEPETGLEEEAAGE